jgi:hypothetical protein
MVHEIQEAKLFMLGEIKHRDKNKNKDFMQKTEEGHGSNI